MGKLTLHAGEDISVAAGRFVEAWERAENGLAPAGGEAETHIVFESWAGLAAILTPKRVELLRHIHRHPAATVAEVAAALGMAPGDIGRDVDELAAAGLIDRQGEALQADYNEIRTAIVM